MSLQVASEHRASAAVINCGHLEQETLVGHWHCFGELARVCIQQVRVFQELTGEASKD